MSEETNDNTGIKSESYKVNDKVKDMVVKMEE